MEQASVCSNDRIDSDGLKKDVSVKEDLVGEEVGPGHERNEVKLEVASKIDDEAIGCTQDIFSSLGTVEAEGDEGTKPIVKGDAPEEKLESAMGQDDIGDTQAMYSVESFESKAELEADSETVAVPEASVADKEASEAEVGKSLGLKVEIPPDLRNAVSDQGNAVSATEEGNADAGVGNQTDGELVKEQSEPRGENEAEMEIPEEKVTLADLYGEAKTHLAKAESDSHSADANAVEGGMVEAAENPGEEREEVALSGEKRSDTVEAKIEEEIKSEATAAQALFGDDEDGAPFPEEESLDKEESLDRKEAADRLFDEVSEEGAKAAGEDDDDTIEEAETEFDHNGQMDEDSDYVTLPSTTPPPLPVSTEDLWMLGLPLAVNIEYEPFDEADFTKREIKANEEHILQEKKLLRQQLAAEVIRVRKNEDGSLTSNARMVEFEDGSCALYIGNKVYEADARNEAQSLLLEVSQAPLYHIHGTLRHRRIFKPPTISALESKTLKVAGGSSNQQKNRTRLTTVQMGAESEQRLKRQVEELAAKEEMLQRRNKKKRSAATVGRGGEDATCDFF